MCSLYVILLFRWTHLCLSSMLRIMIQTSLGIYLHRKTWLQEVQVFVSLPDRLLNVLIFDIASNPFLNFPIGSNRKKYRRSKVIQTKENNDILINGSLRTPVSPLSPQSGICTYSYSWKTFFSYRPLWSFDRRSSASYIILCNVYFLQTTLLRSRLFTGVLNLSVNVLHFTLQVRKNVVNICSSKFKRCSMISIIPVIHVWESKQVPYLI